MKYDQLCTHCKNINHNREWKSENRAYAQWRCSKENIVDLHNEEIESASGVNYNESDDEPKHHFISPFKVDDPITDHVSQVQDNSLSESLTTPVFKDITPVNHIAQQAYVTPGSLTSREPVTSLNFKDPPLPTWLFETRGQLL